MPEHPNRETHRLEGRDYTMPGSYFVTICQHERRCAFGEIREGKLLLSPLGVLAERELLLVPRRRKPWIHVDAYIVMPNHVHAIIRNSYGDPEIHKRIRARRQAQEAREATRLLPPGESYQPPPRLEAMSLGAIVGAYKAGVTREARRLGFMSNETLWQRDFYDHVIRDAEARARISAYIVDNPLNWALDKENSQRNGESEFYSWLDEQGRRPAT